MKANFTSNLGNGMGIVYTVTGYAVNGNTRTKSYSTVGILKAKHFSGSVWQRSPNTVWQNFEEKKIILKINFKM